MLKVRNGNGVKTRKGGRKMKKYETARSSATQHTASGGN